MGRFSGPPLIVRFIGLVVGALIAAQLVTLLLTLVLPPAPPREYALADIAAALRNEDQAGDRFDRVVQSGPPDLSTQGWFVSESSRDKLAGLLRRPVADVALGFYTQLPVGGAVEPVSAPDRLPDDAERQRGAAAEPIAPPAALAAAAMQEATLVPAVLFETRAVMTPAALLQVGPGGPPGGGFPGGGPPGGGFPGSGLPGGGFPQSLPPAGRPQSQVPLPQVPRQPQIDRQPLSMPSASSPAPSTAQGASAGPPPQSALPTVPSQAGPPTGLNGPQSPGAIGGLPPQLPLVPDVTQGRRGDLPVPQSAPTATRTPTSRSLSEALVAPEALLPNRTVPIPATPAISLPEEAASPTTDAAPVVAPAPAPIGTPVPIVRPSTGFFGLAPSPFVEGDFIAGVRRPDGRWVVVSPRAEGFPNAWQRRVALWFLLSLLAVAPIAWLFARRIVGPLNDFAYAADVLGRDPGAAVLPLDGPAEIGRAAHAFNQMQSRLRSFVDDRTAMIGAISHDLRTPLTRLRFRIEDVPDDQQEGLREEVAEMEEMISSVIAFMRDASIPNARERRDFAELVDDVIEDATMLGDVETGRLESAIVDIDPLGMRRVLDNLLTNAMKYGGGHTRVALTVENDIAIADIIDNGPGVPDSELERIFEPFYRSEAARTSGREGSGLGLAVCRSIARAHGGDVALFRSADGFTARVTLPLAFTDDRRAA
ncbi:HAMP domain-containing protein [Sphingomonas carotinifaciens]|uniref:histidine kinase n=1 Tax=Sphingomonas carotinifaciens TaxID=1166323 RepID=A0A6N8LYG6_9SPHN|nr:HAMP domain-containing protein [Sphingomonas carotinifaciens]